MRDLLVLQDALDWKIDGNDAVDPLDQPGSALVCALFFNDRVPDRHRLSDEELVRMTMSAQARAKRDLLKAVYNGWRALGVSAPRGKTLPTPRVLLQRVDHLVHAVRDHLSE
jgi:hypothetical protein